MIKADSSLELLAAPSLAETVHSFTTDFLQIFPRAQLLLGNNVDSDADVEIDIYVPREEIESAGIKADELALNFDIKTGYFIIPIVLPLDAYPVK
ncbi:MAG: hypothetical protein HY327_14245 [Chloroflexi bacterium]|nr:hypothetical protein [Chloroflexota bacterium]